MTTRKEAYQKFNKYLRGKMGKFGYMPIYAVLDTLMDQRRFGWETRYRITNAIYRAGLSTFDPMTENARVQISRHLR